jgi:hypothetical protein
MQSAQINILALLGNLSFQITFQTGFLADIYGVKDVPPSLRICASILGGSLI